MVHINEAKSQSGGLIYTMVSAILLFSVCAISAVYMYTYFLLVSAGVAWESIVPTFIFIAFFVAGSVAVVFGFPRRWGIITWIARVVVTLFTAVFWNWFFSYIEADKFLGVAVQHYAWGASVILSFGLQVAELIMLIKSTAGRIEGIPGIVPLFTRGKHAVAKVVAIIMIPLVLLPLADPTAKLVSTPTLTRDFTITDNNAGCTLAIWDAPQFTAQVGNTTTIDLGLLTANQTRLLVALGRMNTTFFYALPMGSPLDINYTIAYLKMLDAFNLSFCWNIGYSHGFITAEDPEEWIANARAVLDFCIFYYLTNVIGITADAEGSTELDPTTYWQNIAAYDSFLREVQQNASLAHPDPAYGTFETILTIFEVMADDLIDGDSDNTYREGSLGIPPTTWTRVHYMLYRALTSPERAPVWMYNYLNIIKHVQGTATIAPIVGVTGCDWFCEGWLSEPDHGNCTDYGTGNALSTYDGVAGWAALKREILLCKAYGFYQVSIFHLNAYVNPERHVIEEHGLLDYYGLDAIEDLADAWTAGGSLITIPISTFRFQTSSDDFFGNHGMVVNDVYFNEETSVFMASLAVLIVLLAILVQKGVFKKRDN
jgi:hypothetical protein